MRGDHLQRDAIFHRILGCGFDINPAFTTLAPFSALAALTDRQRVRQNPLPQIGADDVMRRRFRRSRLVIVGSSGRRRCRSGTAGENERADSDPDFAARGHGKFSQQWRADCASLVVRWRKAKDDLFELFQAERRGFANARQFVARHHAMQIVIADILKPDDLAKVHAALAKTRFIDGRETAGFAARKVKDNRQADARDKTLAEMRDLVATRIMDSELFRLAARPKMLSPLLFSRTETGMQYGVHIDDALMGGMRTDVSFTLFLDEPESYDGGELVIESAAGDDAIKLPAGAMVAYPSTALHRVAQVTRGRRHVVAGWARSFVRDAAQRELLFDLDTARRAIFVRDGKSAEFDLISKSVANLLRMWAED
jgi:PKHD-type hydroxylase